MDGLLEWSNLFRCLGTFANYVGHVRTACVALGLEMPPASDPALQRAKGAIVKRMLFTKRCAAVSCVAHCFPPSACFHRPRMFLQRTHVRNLIAAVATGVESEKFAMLWLMAYVFLLRVPSEALPMVRGEADAQADEQAVFYP